MNQERCQTEPKRPISRTSRHLDVVDMGLHPYAKTLTFQETLVERRKTEKIGDTLILVEHEPVYTLGGSASEQNVLLPPEELARKGITVIRTTRGGDVTYHGPGQLVVYPILKLSHWPGVGPVWYVGQLERVVILTLAEFGVPAGTDPRGRGVWVHGNKIAAIGVRITRGVTMHGFALNIAVNLEHFSGIVPCGIRDRGITSLHLLADVSSVEEVKPCVVRCFKTVFGYD